MPTAPAIRFWSFDCTIFKLEAARDWSMNFYRSWKFHQDWLKRKRARAKSDCHLQNHASQQRWRHCTKQCVRSSSVFGHSVRSVKQRVPSSVLFTFSNPATYYISIYIFSFIISCVQLGTGYITVWQLDCNILTCSSYWMKLILLSHWALP